ncbi:Leucine-rich repeat-containing protein [Artemisia annua]|uniref:non-specific serine/threonine protein kinase n=1 Tax=Artemisia annua TaxID=35608 RepID=A0A2U1QDH5_ARTAN|nr:Leucine-rich repeat-containing protein [Artemisia annua]
MNMLLCLVFLILPLSSCYGLSQEAGYLHKMKLGFDDPDGFFHSWTGDDSPCSWTGVTCSEPGSTGSVVSVDLSNANIAGPFPVVLCMLNEIKFISFFNNSVNGSLSDELTSCRKLEHLNLAQNYLTGELPESLPELTELKVLDLTGNNFSGEIPASYGRFQSLEVISLVDNLISGKIPAVVGNITTLKQLNLSYNPFTAGEIPAEIGRLKNLEVLWLTGCNLIGPIPDSLSQLGQLVDLDLAINKLTGSIPSSLTELRNVVQIELYNNSLTGELPKMGWSKMTSLRLLDVSMNLLTGNVPEELCSLQLESLNLYENEFVGKFPDIISNSSNLYELRVFGNRFTGELPESLGKKSPLTWVDVSNNMFTGRIPGSLCDKGVLEEVLMIHNSFSGEIPGSFSKCRSLKRVRLGYNKLSGEVPVGFWGLPQVSLLELVENSLSGGIGKTIAGAGNLSTLNIAHNKFSGELPDEIGFLDSLNEFSGSNNMFSGSLPASIVNLEQLTKLDLHNNGFTGGLPSGISSLKKLNELDLANNKLSGNIPDKIGELSVLNYLDLSRNQFSGKIPVGLQNLRLNQLNLSSNSLTGDIPPVYAKKMYITSFLGNPGLCGDIEGLCDGKNVTRNVGYIWLLRSIFVLTGCILIIGVGWFFWRYKNFKKSKDSIDKSKWTLMSFHKLSFSEYEILGALDEDNVIGSGSSGKVYRVVLSNGDAVAVKKLWSSSKKGDDEDLENGSVSTSVLDNGFEAEVETLGKIRHKNIVRLWCCCSTRTCKLLVYEYMPNGSLGDLLHSSKSGLLDWPTRYKIAVDAAEGLAYLHHDCVPAIVHRDVKSNNILLDGDFGARVADFGVAKVVDGNEKGGNSMSVIAGSCGYIAPEYAYTLRVNEKSDIYSFGVVILELVTGKLPVDPEFGEKDLVKWVCTTLDQKGVDVVLDPKLDSCFKEEICKVLNVGLLCTSPLPINRPSMRRVVKMLQEIGSVNPMRFVSKDGKLTPYYYDDASDHGSVA